MNLGELNRLLNDNHGNHEKCTRIYEENFHKILKNEGLNDTTARLVESICWEHGHSAGYYEVVNYAYDFVEFAKIL